MAMWQRGGNLLHHRLSKLYSDTKQSYEEAKCIPTVSANIEDNPDVIAIRKDFTIQQDRLLAWGMHWADVGAQATSSYWKGQDVNIDKKIDQAGLGDVVASVMEEIKRLLDESGKLQHPERYELTKKPSSPRLQRKDWKEYEVTTGRVLLDQLTSCIDVLYSLIENQKREQGKSPRNKSMSVDEAFGTSNEDATAAQIYSHPLYIDFANLAPMHDPDASAEPPSYDDAQDSSGIKARSIYYYPAAQAHVVVDLVSTRTIPNDQDSKSPLQQLHQLSDKLSGGGLLSWDGHLKLLGFTVAAASSRYGLVYALPAPNDQTALQKYQTLSTTIASSCDRDISIPPLEDKLRLAYNIALLMTGYLAHNSTHGYINSSNIMFLREHENSRQLGHTVRCPYLLQPIKKVVGVPVTGETQQDSMYHHPDADEAGYGSVAAYDIYSLGLVLLELGLWMPIKKFYKAKYDRSAFSERLRRVYSCKLASKCGTRYMKVVQRCLDAPEALVDKSSIIDAAEYLLQAVKDLAYCCILDEDEQPSPLDVEIFEALIEEQRAMLPPANTQIKRKPVPSHTVTLDKSTLLKTASSQSKPKSRRKYPPGSGHSSLETTALRKFPDVPIPQQHLNEWNTFLMPKLSKMLDHVLKGSEESASVSLMMLGKTPDQAKTTICIQCTDTTGVRDMICKRFKPARGWGVVIVKGDVRRSGRHRTHCRKPRRPRRSAGSASGSSEEMRTKQQEYQKRPGPGASIGAFKDGEHLPPVSFGGTILVDGEMYGMTVHHMLDDPSDESDSDLDEETLEEDEEMEEKLVDNVRRSMAPRQHDEQWHRGLHEASKKLGFDEDSFSPEPQEEDDEPPFDDEAYESDSDASTIRPDYLLFDDDGNEHWVLDDSDVPDLDDHYDSSGDEDETASIGDTPGIEPYTMDEEDLCITQPALDDVDEDFFPSPEDRDDDHLASHAFGHIHASSGIKRVLAGGLKHEVDWALIRVNEDRRIRQNAQSKSSSRARPSSSTSSTASDNRSGPASEPCLTSISSLQSLPNTRVTCIARTSGPSKGRISPALSLVKLRGRTTTSASFTVEGGFGLPGDSGAWIWSEERNELCGHVLAYSHALQQAYMAPMEVMVEDIRKTLNADKVELPAEAARNARAAAEEKMRGKKLLDVVEGHIERAESDKGSKDLGRARELEAALAGLTMDEPSSRPLSDTNVSGGQALSRFQAQTTSPAQAAPMMHHIDIVSPTTRSTTSSFPCPLPRGSATGANGGTHDRSETPRTKKERFDIHLTGGGSDLQILPMAHALS